MKRIVNKTFAFMAFSILLITSCTKNNSDYSSSAVPNETVNLTLNINSSAYASLATVGGIAYLTNVGYRGILLYRYSSNTIMAYDRTCTYDIADAGGVVYAETNGTAVCVDCGSAYNLNNGSVNAGPTTIGLKVYITTYNASTGVLTINN